MAAALAAGRPRVHARGRLGARDVIVIIGGMGSLVGAFAGGLLVSVVESLGAVFLKPSLKELVKLPQLELARALGTEPALLLLDEVMSGLNATETERLVELVRGVNRRGVAILLIEHVMRAAMSLASRVIVLNYGERIAEGRPEEVASDPRVIEAYLGDERAGAAGA